MSSWFETWIEQYKAGTCKASTLQTYRQTFEHYIHKKGVSKSRINIVYLILCGMFEQAQRNRLILNNPANALVFPRFRKRTQNDRRVMTVDEQRIFLEYAKESPYFSFYVMALSTGMRINEITALQWSDIDWTNKVIHVTGTLVYVRNGGGRYKDSPKTESSRRDIPMLANVEELLKEIRKVQMENRLLLGAKWKEETGLENLVFTYETGGALWDTGVRVDMGKIVDRIHTADIEFEAITPHAFYHIYCSNMDKSWMIFKTFQYLMGHSNISATMNVYTHIS